MEFTYIMLLYQQYCNAVGKKYDKFNIAADMDFLLYLNALADETKDYMDYLNSLDLYFYKDMAIELDKGRYDSLGEDAVTIVSPFAEMLGYQNAELLINDNTPYVITSSSLFCVDSCDLFLTHNPLLQRSAYTIMMLYNCGFHVCMGVYGKLSDKDKIEKLAMLKDYQLKMGDNVEFNYDVSKDNYFGCINDKCLKLKKTLVLSKE